MANIPVSLSPKAAKESCCTWTSINFFLQLLQFNQMHLFPLQITSLSEGFGRFCLVVLGFWNRGGRLLQEWICGAWSLLRFGGTVFGATEISFPSFPLFFPPQTWSKTWCALRSRSTSDATSACSSTRFGRRHSRSQTWDIIQIQNKLFFYFYFLFGNYVLQFGANDSGSKTLHYAVDITCQYNPRDKHAAFKCKKAVDDVRANI